MKRMSIGTSATGATAALSFCLVANLVALMTFPAVLPQVSAEWQLSASEAGWIGGIYFAGYAIAVLFLVGATDHFDGRWIIVGSSLLGAGASFAFAGLADGFWPALAVRFLGGIALAGVHMPGLVLLTERIRGPKQARSVSIYTASYALGSAGSFFVAGIVDALFGWRATFLAAGIGPLLAVAAVACLSPAPARQTPAGPFLEFRSVLANRGFMAYALGFAGNTWEVFSIRVWFVACLSWTLHLPGNELDLPNLAVISGLASLAGVPASIVVAELATRWNRPRVIIATCVVSVAVCLALAATAGGTIAVVLALLILLQITSFADVNKVESASRHYCYVRRFGGGVFGLGRDGRWDNCRRPRAADLATNYKLRRCERPRRGSSCVIRSGATRRGVGDLRASRIYHWIPRSAGCGAQP